MKTTQKIILNIAKIVTIFTLLLTSSCNNDESFTDNIPDVSKAIIKSFVINEKFATIDHTNATITMTLPATTELDALVVDIKLPEGTTITPASGSTVDFSDGPVTFKTKSEQGAVREYTASIAAFGNPKIMSFNIGENIGVIDDAQGTITLNIGSQDGDITKLTPNFIIAEGTTVDKASGVSQNFINPVKYTVLSNDGYTAKEYTVSVTQIEAAKINSFKIGQTTGLIDDQANTIYILAPIGTDISALTPTIVVPDGQSISPSSGVQADFTSPVVYTVTNTENLTRDYTVTVEVQQVVPTFYAFLGEQSDISSLIDDDAKAAATWMQNKYGADFKYIQFSNITGAEMADVKVAMMYYLTPKEDVGYFATATDVSTMLPAGLRPGGDQAKVLKNWAKGGGNMLLAGDATPLIFSLERIPADFSAPRAAGNYLYSEFGCADSAGCVDTGKASDDIWGLGMRDGNNSTNRRTHEIFNGLTFIDDEYLALNNADTREVRLIWFQHFDGILSPSCCGQDAAEYFEQKVSATKFGTLRHIGDAFGYGAILWNSTDGTNDSNFDSTIGTDFQGNIFSIENTIVGYEWDSNGTVNDYQSNIETLTGNIIDYLYNLD